MYNFSIFQIQKLYARYIRAEKYRKSLVYQKKYLVLLVGEFRTNETTILAMIAKMGAYPSYHEPTSRFSTAFTKFRSAVRVVVAINRMQFLVEKTKKSVRQVMETVDSKSNSHRITHSSKKSVYHDGQYNSHRPISRHNIGYHNISSQSDIDIIHTGSQHGGDISIEPKNSSFTEIYPASKDIRKHTDSGIYSAFDFKPTEMFTLGHAQPNSDPTNRLDSRNMQR